MCNHDHDTEAGCGVNRRHLLTSGLAATAAVAGTVAVGTAAGAGLLASGASPAAAASSNPGYADPAEPALPQTDVTIGRGDTALVVVDPLVDFLHPDGVAWGVVGESVTEHQTVENIGRLLVAARKADFTIAISPHYYYPTDHGWQFAGPLEKLMHSIGMFDRKGSLSLEGFEGSGADFMPQYKEVILDGKTVIVCPHKVYGPETNDLDLQLRKRGIRKVVLAGMSANLCVQAHLYNLLERGYEVAVVRDATAAAKLPEGDGYLAALTNFRYVANALWSTEETLLRIEAAS